MAHPYKQQAGDGRQRARTRYTEFDVPTSGIVPAAPPLDKNVDPEDDGEDEDD